MKTFVKEKVCILLFWMYTIWVVCNIFGAWLMAIVVLPTVWKYVIGLLLISNFVFLKEIEQFFEKNTRL